MGTIGRRGDHPLCFKVSRDMLREVNRAAKKAKLARSEWLRRAVSNLLWHEAPKTTVVIGMGKSPKKLSTALRRARPGQTIILPQGYSEVIK